MKAINLLVFVGASFLAACQTNTHHNAHDNPVSRPPVGSIVQLHRSIVFGRGISRSFVQYGQARSFGGLNMAEPWCQFYLFESREAMKKPRTIAADQFIVTQSSQRAEFAQSAVSRFDVASSGASFTLARTRNGGDAGFKSMATTLKLHSDKQPQLVELKCTVYADPFHYNFVSVNKIQEILVPIASLQFE